MKIFLAVKMPVLTEYRSAYGLRPEWIWPFASRDEAEAALDADLKAEAAAHSGSGPFYTTYDRYVEEADLDIK